MLILNTFSANFWILKILLDKVRYIRRQHLKASFVFFGAQYKYKLIVSHSAIGKNLWLTMIHI